MTTPERALVEALEAARLYVADRAVNASHAGVGSGARAAADDLARIDAALARYREASAAANTPEIPDGCAASPIVALPPPPTLTPVGGMMYLADHRAPSPDAALAQLLAALPAVVGEPGR